MALLPRVMIVNGEKLWIVPLLRARRAMPASPLIVPMSITPLAMTVVPSAKTCWASAICGQDDARKAAEDIRPSNRPLNGLLFLGDSANDRLNISISPSLMRED